MNFNGKIGSNVQNIANLFADYLKSECEEDITSNEMLTSPNVSEVTQKRM